jgi:predicted aspartyl protease
MTVYTHDYDSRFYPAIPIVEIQVRRHANQSPIILIALVDSGADNTMIPKSHLRRLKARKSATKWLIDAMGDRHEVDLYKVAVQIGMHRPVYVDAVAAEQEEIIVGRDVLNEFVVTLNAPAHTVEIAADSEG